MADLTDLDELQTGQKRSGMFFALLTTSTKLGAALAVGGSFALLELVYGFTPRGANDAAAIDGLVLIYTMGSAGGMMLAFLCIARYGLTRARHAEIRAELDERARQADSLA
jgi:Na+/melibiose symporter-like transporter